MARQAAQGVSVVCLLSLAALAGPLLAALCGCGRAGGATGDTAADVASVRTSSSDAVPDALLEPAVSARDAVAELETLRSGGRFDEFVNRALNAADEHPTAPALQLLKAEALLAVADNAAAESSAQRAATLAVDSADTAVAVAALKLWVTARFRQSKPLASAAVVELLAQLPPDDSGAQMVNFWIDELSEQVPYQIDDVVDEPRDVPYDVPSTRAAAGTIWAELNSIEAVAAGVQMPMVFIDTGTQHTIITRRTAESAGVVVDEGGTELVGFAGVAARPGVLDSLELGALRLRNVPVLVADSTPLIAAKGQMAIGTELMHHVRFTLDYPARRVTVERADRPPVEMATGPSWEVPLWTFPQACLARADLAGGGAARVLIDTGNRRGTFVAADWARRHMSQFARPTSSLIFKFKHQNLSLDTMDLGNATLRDWPIWDRLPTGLERLDLVDVLVGHDLLWPYQVTIDLGQRVMRLAGGPPAPVPPTDELP